MSIIDKTDYSLSGILPVVPRFDFHDAIHMEAPVQWEALAAFYDYEQNVRPIAHDWSIERGRWAWDHLHKPWYCHL